MIKEKTGIFLKISNRYCVFEFRFGIRSPKLLLTSNFSLIQKQRNNEDLHCFSCRYIKMTIMTSYFRIGDDTIKILIPQDFYPSYIPTKFQHHLDLNQKKIIKKVSSLIMFLAEHSPINWLPLATINDLPPSF